MGAYVKEHGLEWARLWADGQTYKDIAATYGYTWHQVAHAIRSVTTPAERAERKRKILEPNRIRNEEWARRREDGESWSAIAKDYGVGWQTVANAVAKIRPDLTDQVRADALRSTRSLSARYGTAWADRYLAGESAKDIADSVGISPKTVLYVLRKQGYSARPRAVANSTPRGRAGYKRVTTSSGYISTRIPKDHPYAAAGHAENESPHTVRILEHRLVMSEKLGRALRPDESVHHINGDRTDNRPENLELRQGKHGTGVAYRCLDCGSNNVETAALSHPSPEPL